MDDHGVISQAESDDEILAFDVLDEALERTASTEQPGLILRRCALAPAAWRYSPRSAAPHRDAVVAPNLLLFGSFVALKLRLAD